MNKTVKKNLIEFGVFGGIILVLYLTGLHTEVFGFMQRGILKTGLLNPDVGIDDGTTTYPEADFRLRLVSSKGEKVNMENFRGKVIFLNLWATWCPPCIAEMPGINQLYGELKNEEIVFLMLSLDKDFEKAIKYKEKKNFGFEIYSLDGGIPPMYNSQSIPTTYVIDAEGKLVLTHEGMADYSDGEFKDFLLGL